MKKGLVGLMAAVMLLTAGTGALAAGHGACRSGSGNCFYTDADGDGVCDFYGTASGNGCGYRQNFVDADYDGICDYAGSYAQSAGRGHHGGGGCRR